MNTRRDLVLAIHPVHAEKILAGIKTYELRSRFPGVDPGTKVYLYATAPISAVIGGFEVGAIVSDSPAHIWKTLSRSLCVTKSTFDEYASGRAALKAIEVLRPFRLDRPVSRRELQELSETYTPPQSAGFLRHLALQHRLEHLSV